MLLFHFQYLLIKGDLDGTIFAYDYRMHQLMPPLHCQSCRVNQTYNTIMTEVHESKNVVAISNMF